MANTFLQKLFGLKNPTDDPGNLDLATTSVTMSKGAEDAFKYVGTGANGMIDATLIDGTAFGKPDIETAIAGEQITAPALVNTYSNGGVNTARMANNTSYGLRVTGVVLDTVAAGATVKVYKSGLVAGFTGLKIGQNYAGATPGQPTDTPPATGIAQKVGNASSATTLHLAIGPAYGL